MTTYRVKQKIAPGLAAGVEFEVTHEDEDGKHLIVTTYGMEKVLVDGVMKRRKVGTNHRITTGSLKKAEPVTSGDEG